MTPTRPRAYLFPPFRLDLKTGALYRGEENLNLRPKTFDTLLYLLRHQGRLVSKSELMEKIWADSFVTDDVLVQSIADIRRSLGDDARNPVFVRTVPRRGYMFVKEAVQVGETDPEPVQDSGAELLDESAADPFVTASFPFGFRMLAALMVILLAVLLAGYWKWLRLAPKPVPTTSAIAVLPFEVQSDTPGYEWLAVGIPDMIGTGLWKSPEPVISIRRLRETALRKELRWSEITIPQALDLARSLGAARAVSGSLIKLGSEIQVTASLIDLSDDSEALSLSERVKAPEEIFEAIDGICLRILQIVAFQKGLHGAPGPHLTEITTSSLDAYRHYIAGLELFLKGGREGADLAEVELREATRIDPSFALAHFKLAQVKHWARAWGYSKADPIEPLRKAIENGAELPEMERLLMSGMAAWLVENDPAQALEIWQRLEESYPMFAAETGLPSMKVGILMERGLLQEAIEYGEPFTKSPYLTVDDKARLSSQLAKAFRKLGNIPRAVSYSEKCVADWPVKNSQIYRFHLINLGRNYLDAGRTEEALKCFRSAGEGGSGDAANLTDAGWGFYMAADKRLARQLAEAALAADPEYGNAYHLIGWLDLSDNRLRSAARFFEEAFDRTPPQFGSKFEGMLDGDLAALYYSGVAYSKLGDREKAETLFLTLISLCQRVRNWASPDPASVVTAQSLTLQALAEARLGRLESSVRTRGAISLETQNLFELYVQLARIYAVQGNRRAAAENLRKAVDAGAREFQHIRDNPDFENIRNEPEFRTLDPAP